LRALALSIRPSLESAAALPYNWTVDLPDRQRCRVYQGNLYDVRRRKLSPAQL
jgi:hypothetical protein